MITKDNILQICNETLSESQFVVDIKINNANEILVFIDDMNGLTIEECKRISRFIESQLDRENEDFSLEVGSPGLSNPFKVKQQYIKNLNKEVEIVMKDGEKITGKILEAGENEVTIETSAVKKINNKKQVITEQTKIEYLNIKTAKSIISFK